VAAISESAWTKLIEAFDPSVPLAESLDALYVERASDTPSNRIARELGRRHDARTKYVIIGARGAGKTTELWRIARKLEGTRYNLGIDLAVVGALFSSGSLRRTQRRD
jgi:signal recognition particle GTPase